MILIKVMHTEQAWQVVRDDSILANFDQHTNAINDALDRAKALFAEGSDSAVFDCSLSPSVLVRRFGHDPEHFWAEPL
ncbi:hypothetical protein [Caulobacter sp. S45]|jgi:hypothetical protein|uniref:hypothetical protein n=1 Tax=Caulobacter sp. S45 TaxID=1641861 RepID=UPI00131DC983|nr:hypothetical protein [Caulobacter sp. S45]